MSFEIFVSNVNEHFSCDSLSSLLGGVERQRLKAIKVGCRGGGCGFCKIKIISGDYEQKKMSKKHITDEDEKNGFALSCRIFPRSDMEIEAVDVEINVDSVDNNKGT